MFKSKVLSFDRPVLIKGKDLRVKLVDKLKQMEKQRTELATMLKSRFSNTNDDESKVEQKKQIMKLAAEIKARMDNIDRLLEIIDDKYEYTLTLNEAQFLNMFNK
jgi:hypothetical protein